MEYTWMDVVIQNSKPLTALDFIEECCSALAQYGGVLTAQIHQIGTVWQDEMRSKVMRGTGS